MNNSEKNTSVGNDAINKTVTANEHITNEVSKDIPGTSNSNIFELKIEDIQGTNTEVLTIYLYELNKFMHTHDLSRSEKILYSALYTSLQYYKDVSDPTTPFFQQTLDYLNKETLALQRKHPDLSIKTSLRIKSPISAYNKIIDKIQEYIQKGRDLNNLNTSLRDFIGVRRIVDIKDVLFESPVESTNKCFDFAASQLCYQDKSNFKLIPVGDEKLAKMKKPHQYNLDPNEEHVYIPPQRPKVLEYFDKFIKDYISYPKESLYQTLQYCTYLPFSKKYPIEYQVRSQYMHNYAENGGADHRKYKKGFENKDSDKTVENEFDVNDKRFRRANLPIEYIFDSKLKKMRQYSLDESMKSHLGYSFTDRFGITENEFYKNFSKEEQDNILALTHSFTFDETTGKYVVLPIHTAKLPSLIKTSATKLHSDVEEAVANGTAINSFFSQDDGR